MAAAGNIFVAARERRVRVVCGAWMLWDTNRKDRPSWKVYIYVLGLRRWHICKMTQTVALQILQFEICNEKKTQNECTWPSCIRSFVPAYDGVAAAIDRWQRTRTLHIIYQSKMYKNNTEVIDSVHKHHIFNSTTSSGSNVESHVSPKSETEGLMGRHEVREQRNRILCYIYHINSHPMTKKKTTKRCGIEFRSCPSRRSNRPCKMMCHTRNEMEKKNGFRMWRVMSILLPIYVCIIFGFRAVAVPAVGRRYIRFYYIAFAWIPYFILNF